MCLPVYYYFSFVRFLYVVFSVEMCSVLYVDHTSKFSCLSINLLDTFKLIMGSKHNALPIYVAALAIASQNKWRGVHDRACVVLSFDRLPIVGRLLTVG